LGTKSQTPGGAWEKKAGGRHLGLVKISEHARSETERRTAALRGVSKKANQNIREI